MSIEVRRKQAQVPGGFNGGAILENRPLIPGHGDKAKPFSNLFYWAHAWSDNGSLLGEHPHEAFEIMTFVLRGRIEHYDSHTKAWKPLEAGSAQIIRAGSGLSHAERFFPGSHIFQIWFDPNLEEAIQDPPSYDDYPDAV
ncbi:MAG: pirin family protein, partial [Spirochaetia bacterium]|nr:pirin family protein [Spirochaetia bacterium]